MIMIDYIYLILILILIGFIIFIIYLSYEYRIKEGFTVEEDNINYIYQLSTKLQEQKDQNRNLDLLKQTQDNLITSKKLAEFSNQQKKIPNSFPIDKVISTIKSKYNSQYLSTVAKNSNYNVLVNNKCLTVNGLCKDDFCLLDCQNNINSSDSQQFETRRIYSAKDASKFMNVPVNSINSTNVYPFSVFSSVINNNCLMIDNTGLTVDKCNLNDIKQQWEISPNENICVLT